MIYSGEGRAFKGGDKFYFTEGKQRMTVKLINSIDKQELQEVLKFPIIEIF